MVNLGVFYDHLEYFMAIWYTLWPFGIVCGHLLYFSRFGMFGPRKVWQPWLDIQPCSLEFFELLYIDGKIKYV
jgi:hypothetical protein